MQHHQLNKPNNQKIYEAMSFILSLEIIYPHTMALYYLIILRRLKK